MGWAGNVWTGVDRWIEAETLWKSFQSQVLEERKITIHYEDLVSNPIQVLTSICQLIGTEYSSDMMNYIQVSTYSGPDPKYASKWKSTLSKHEIQLVESKVGSMLIASGYEASGLEDYSVSYFQGNYLGLQNWWKCIQFRIKRNGLSLVLSDFLSRHLGLSNWQKNVRLKLNDIEAQYLK